MAVARKIGIVCLVTHVCLTTAILTARISLDPTRWTNTTRPWRSYLPSASTPSPKHPRYSVHPDHADDDEPRRLALGDGLQEYLRGLQLASPLNGREQQRTGPQRFPTEIPRDGARLSARVPSASPSPSPSPTMKTTALSGSQRHSVPRRLAYQGIEQLDGHLTDVLDDGKLLYRAESTYHRRGPQDLTTAIKALDRFLSVTLNSDSYNSVLHPPPNPVLALVLSRYGRYVPGTRNPRLYAYTAVNNIHNNKPFGKYKYECDEEPIYGAR